MVIHITAKINRVHTQAVHAVEEGFPLLPTSRLPPFSPTTSSHLDLQNTSNVASPNGMC